MNYKNLNYEIETAVLDAAVGFIRISIMRLKLNYKNLNYEIETSVMNYKNLNYEIETLAL